MRRLFLALSILTQYALCQVSGTGQPVLGYTGGGLSCGAPFTCGTATGYACGFSLTIASQSGLSSNLTNIDMPFLGNQGAVSIFKNSANGGAIQSSPKEVVWCSKNDGTGSILPGETVPAVYSGTGGTGIWWLQAPSISHTTTTTVYGLVGKASSVSYNNPFTITGTVSLGTCTLGETVTQAVTGITGIFNLASPYTLADLSGPGADATHLWTGGSSGCQFTPSAIPISALWPNTQFVQHFCSTGGIDLIDSSATMTLTNNGATATTGGLCGGLAFLASSTQNITTSPSFSCCANFTFESMIANGNAGNSAQAIGNNANSGGSTGIVDYILLNGTAGCTFTACGTVGYVTTSGSFYYKETNGSIGTTTTPHWVAGTHATGSANMSIYLDGALSNGVVQTAGSPTDPSIVTAQWVWGRNGNNTSLDYFTGTLFEQRLYSTILTDDQIAWHHTSQSTTPYTLSTP